MVSAKLKLYTTIPDSPQIPQTPLTKSINMIGLQLYSDKDENIKISINPVITELELNWKNQIKFYYPRETAPDLFFRRKGFQFHKFQCKQCLQIERR